jgi:hypothetical protein
MREDIAALTVDLPAQRPSLAGVIAKDSMLPWRDEFARVTGRSARMAIAMRLKPMTDWADKIHASTAFKISEILEKLKDIIDLGLSLFGL